MDAVTFAFARDALAATLPGGLIVDVGARDVNGSLRASVPADCRYIGIDLRQGPNVDVRATGAALPVHWPSVIVACSVFEHTPDGEAICREAGRALAPGGRFIVTTVDARWPPHSAIDGRELQPGEYYVPVTAAQLAAWCSDFPRFTLTVTERGDLLAVAETAIT